jgi:hypothetical protein
VGIGVADIIFMAIPVTVLGGGALALYVLFRALAGKAKRFGYSSTVAYLRAVPRTDAEKQDAADVALKGLVLCLLGVIFSPFVLAGLIPLFYGGRKVVYASMGLGLVDDGEQPGA